MAFRYVSNNNEKIAVIVVNFNGGVILNRCLESIRNQSLQPTRVIIIDNASHDDSLESAKNTYPEFEFVVQKENIGFAAANNFAANIVNDCDWVALLNPDAFADRDWLENLFVATQKNTNFVFFGSRLLMDDNSDRLDGVGDVYHVSGAHWRRGYNTVSKPNYLDTAEIFAPCAAAVLYRRDAFLEANGFDEAFFCYGEDVDLGFRLRLLGYRALYIPNAVVRHVGSASTGIRSNFTVYHGHRNLVWIYIKNMPWPLFWVYLPQHLVINLLSIVLYIVRGQSRTILKAKWDAIKGLRRVLRERRKIQTSRVVSSMALRKVMMRGIFRK
ncbi:MAG: glycosyltransferase family 2 protein [Gammaproteobacteria bacterium]|nr:glycosyltransferase family 2 protein [Gammaproteobacteria bacterium]